MSRARLVVIASTLLASSAVTGGQQSWRKNINDASLAAIQTWVDAVRTHTPGRADEAVVTVASFSYEKREDLNTGMSLFLAALMGWSYDTERNRAAEWIVAAGRAAGKDFLKQAAVLHADVAAYGDLYPNAPGTARTGPRRENRETQELHLGQGGAPIRLSGADPIPPLLMGDRLLLNKDGQIVGEVIASWNWPFARSLLDLLSASRQRKIFTDGRPEPATDPFVSAWYHTTTAYMFARGSYGDATPHLLHASMLLPDDALMLFDRACYAEFLGLPIHQALRSTGTSPRATPKPRIPAVDATNAEAERLFRRAVAVDPSLVEARVRLSRLLLARGRHQEAAAELKTALAANPSGVAAFYARLFAGRVAQALGNLDEAAQHYEQATALYPDAQSALLGSSQLALLRADVKGTLTPLERLSARAPESAGDPWWQYDLGAGREADVLLKVLWARVPTRDP